MSSPIKVAVVVRDLPRFLPPLRQRGGWSYPVSEFEFEFFPVEKYQQMKRSDFSDFDIIFVDGVKCYPRWVGTGPPLVYKVSDSFLTQHHLKVRQEYARKEKVDMILVDFGYLDAFSFLAPTYRFSYSVNDHIFHDYYGLEKEVDVCWLCGKGGVPEKKEKRRLIEWRLKKICERCGYTFLMDYRPNYKYARGFSSSKITVNSLWGAFSNQRFFDAMACRTCLLTERPQVNNGGFIEGEHFVGYGDLDEMEEKIMSLMISGEWIDIADSGYNYVHRNHSWKARATYLHKLLIEERYVES